MNIEKIGHLEFIEKKDFNFLQENIIITQNDKWELKWYN